MYHVFYTNHWIWIEGCLLFPKSFAACTALGICEEGRDEILFLTVISINRKVMDLFYH